MRPFVLQRDIDGTGVSGTGIVAEGVEFSDGVVALRWIVPPGVPGHGYPTSVVFHERGIASVEAVHGHGGNTRVEFTDDKMRDLLHRVDSIAGLILHRDRLTDPANQYDLEAVRRAVRARLDAMGSA